MVNLVSSHTEPTFLKPDGEGHTFEHFTCRARFDPRLDDAQIEKSDLFLNMSLFTLLSIHYNIPANNPCFAIYLQSNFALIFHGWHGLALLIRFFGIIIAPSLTSLLFALSRDTLRNLLFALLPALVLHLSVTLVCLTCR